MSGAKKIEPVSPDPINAKIQRKFDLVFTPMSEKAQNASEKNSSVFNDSIDFNTSFDDEMSMENNSNNNQGDKEKDSGLQIDLDFSMDEEASDLPIEKMSAPAPSAPSGEDDGIGFSLDFETDSSIEIKPEATQATAPIDVSGDSGFSLDDADIGSVEFDEATKKTIVVNANNLTNSNLAEFSLDSTGSTNSSAELMTSEEAKANMESTIKDILRPKFDDTKEIDVSEVAGANLDGVEDSILDFGGHTPSQGFSLENMIDDGEAFSLEPRSNAKAELSISGSDATGEFDISDIAADVEVNNDVEEISHVEAPRGPELPKSAPVFSEPAPSVSGPEPVAMNYSSGSLNTEDSMRFQATIRALREEREDLLAQIKNLKTDTKEFEQDNLTLKANLDEAKIEITILRKRHMVELEDLKYRLTMSEEKKSLSDEKARQADMRREKLEQKVRIDFNQVKQREKELESKLELLSMDVDSQVQSRDQKILELRRKIDALEFNMENASIKEQKSLDDKRKLEDRLNKIMKTLRHSIKNLEDDIDHVEDEDHQKEKN